MKLARKAVLAVTLLLCGGGYIFSQYSFFSGTTDQYVKALDKSPVPLLSLALLLILTLLAFIPEKEGS